MKKIILSLAIIAIGNISQAQQKNPNKSNTSPNTNQIDSKKVKKQFSAEEKAEKFLTQIDQTVALNEKQKPKVRSLALDHFKNVESIKKVNKGDKEKMKPEIDKSRTIFKEGLRKVLSAEQLELWRKSKKENPKKKKKPSSTESKDTMED